MMFRRTTNGLRSLHRFHGVDVLVLCEGGHSVSLQDARAGEGTDGTLDALYWKKIIEMMKLNSSYHTKSIGGKANLKSIAEDIEELGITTITVCIDRDYDLLFSKRIPSKRVVYTFGYSWENDVLSKEVLLYMISFLCSPTNQTAPPKKNTQDLIQDFADSLVRWCEIDIALNQKGKESLFDRSNPMRSLRVNSGPPMLNETELRKRLQSLGYRRGPNRRIRVQKDKVLQICYGGLIGKFAFHLLTYCKGGKKGLNLSYDYFMGIAINHTIEKMQDGHLKQLSRYMNAQRHSLEGRGKIG